MEFPYSFGQLIGALLMVSVATVILRETIFSKSKVLIKNASSVAIASIALTTIYWFGPAKQFNSTYLIAGLIVFVIFQILNMKNRNG